MEERRRKLLFRAWRRGIRELDLMIGSFADEHLADLSESEVDEFERLLAVPDWEMYGWLTGTAEEPPNYAGPLLDRMKQFKYSAQPG